MLHCGRIDIVGTADDPALAIAYPALGSATASAS
jgi:hypothetical protein